MFESMLIPDKLSSLVVRKSFIQRSDYGFGEMAVLGRVRRGYSSVVEHSTADREVPGSNPGVPYHFRKYSSAQL